MEDDKEGDVSSHSFVPLKVPGGQALSDSEIAEALADSLEAFSLWTIRQTRQLLKRLIRRKGHMSVPPQVNRN
jgi:hypothetical protein